MNFLSFVFLVLAALCVGAFVTKPTQEQVEANIRQIIISNIANDRIDQNSSFGEAIFSVGCKLDPQNCYRIIRAAMSVGYEDKIVVSLVVIHAGNKVTRCIGAFNGLHCPPQ